MIIYIKKKCFKSIILLQISLIYIKFLPKDLFISQFLRKFAA